MFWKEHVSALREDRYEVKIEIDVSKPVLMGYIFSRPDDIIIRTSKSSAPRREESFARKRESFDTHVWDDPMGEGANSRRRKGNPRADSIYDRNIRGEIAVTYERVKHQWIHA